MLNCFSCGQADKGETVVSNNTTADKPEKEFVKGIMLMDNNKKIAEVWRTQFMLSCLFVLLTERNCLTIVYFHINMIFTMS